MADKSITLTNHPVPVRLHEEDRQWLDQEAKRRDRSLSWLIREAVREKRIRSTQLPTAA